jgi:ketosteroid isomerase-like protein
MTSQDETRIRELMAAKAAAMRTGDVGQLVAQYTPDVVKFDLAPPLLNPGPRDANMLKNWFAGFAGPVGYEIRDLQVTAGGDVAFCHSVNRLSAIPSGMSAKFDLWFRVTVCLRKLGSEWLIAHEHNSTPFYMDGSFKAALDLKP